MHVLILYSWHSYFWYDISMQHWNNYHDNLCLSRFRVFYNNLRSHQVTHYVIADSPDAQKFALENCFWWQIACGHRPSLISSTEPFNSKHISPAFSNSEIVMAEQLPGRNLIQTCMRSTPLLVRTKTQYRANNATKWNMDVSNTKKKTLIIYLLGFKENKNSSISRLDISHGSTPPN